MKYLLVLIVLYCLSVTLTETAPPATDQLTDDEQKQVFCTKKIKAIATITYSPVACMAEAMGAQLDAKKPKIPKRVTDRFTSTVAQVSILQDLDSFMKWMCKDVPKNMNLIRKSYEKNPNLSQKEAESYSSCLLEDVSATIDEAICSDKSAIAIQFEKERVKCMQENAAGKTCAKEMMAGQAIDAIKIETWLCKSDENPDGYISAEMVCYIGNKDIGKKYLQCLHSAVKKLIKK